MAIFGLGSRSSRQASLVSRASRNKRDDNSSQPIWRVFGLVIGLSILLATFLLFSQRQWKSDQLRSVVIIHSLGDEVRQPLTLVVVRPENKVQVIAIPPDQVIETPFGYGSYNSDALAGLTQLEHLKWSFMAYSLSLEYGAGIDGFIWAENNQSITQLGQIKGLVSRSLISQRPTTLVFWDRLTLWLKLQRVPAYQLEVVNIKPYLDKTNNRLDQSRYDRWAELYLQDQHIRESDYSVIVQNGSGIDGYAQRVGRMLRLIGYYVRGLETIETSQNSEIITDQTTGWPLQRLESIMTVFSKRKDRQLLQEKRSNAIIRLGENQKDLLKD